MMALYFPSEIHIKKCKICKKKNINLGQTALIVVQFWTTEKITPKSALLSLTIL